MNWILPFIYSLLFQYDALVGCWNSTSHIGDPTFTNTALPPSLNYFYLVPSFTASFIASITYWLGPLLLVVLVLHCLLPNVYCLFLLSPVSSYLQIHCQRSQTIVGWQSERENNRHHLHPRWAGRPQTFQVAATHATAVGRLWPCAWQCLC